MKHALSIVLDTWDTRCDCGETFAAPGSAEKGEAHVAEHSGSRGKREDRPEDMANLNPQTTYALARLWKIDRGSAYAYLSRLRLREPLVEKTIESKFPRRARWGLRLRKPAA